MKVRKHTRMLLLCLLLVCPVSSSGFVQAIGVPREPEDSTAEIQALLDRQSADWNKGNLDGFLEGYWDSPKVVFQSAANKMVGFEQVKKRYYARYKDGGKAMGKVTFAEVEVELLGPSSAFARGRWMLEMPDGKRPNGLFTLIFKKFPEGWRIVHDHTSAEG